MSKFKTKARRTADRYLRIKSESIREDIVEGFLLHLVKELESGRETDLLGLEDSWQWFLEFTKYNSLYNHNSLQYSVCAIVVNGMDWETALSHSEVFENVGWRSIEIILDEINDIIDKSDIDKLKLLNLQNYAIPKRPIVFANSTPESIMDAMELVMPKINKLKSAKIEVTSTPKKKVVKPKKKKKTWKDTFPWASDNWMNRSFKYPHNVIKKDKK